MQERHSDNSGSRNSVSDPSARPGKLLSNPAVRRNFYDPGQVIRAPPTLAFNPQEAQIKLQDRKRLLIKYAQYRNRAVWAQALVLFNVVGIPLSYSVYLEYYFTSALPTSSLSALAVIPALQFPCIMGMPVLIGSVYHARGQHSGWGIAFLVATLLALAAQVPLLWVKSYTPTMILQGPVLGAALGTLFTLSTLVLSSHYRVNLPLVSMHSWSLGFAGAMVHAIVARQGVGKAGFAPRAAAGVMGVTLLGAYALMRRVKHADLPPGVPAERSDTHLPKSMRAILKEDGTVAFMLGYMLVLLAIFVFPTYIVLILTQPPALLPRGTATYILLATLVTASLSACVAANRGLRTTLGPVNTFVAACVVAGAASLIPAWIPTFWAASVCGAAYGIGLGAIMALHIKVTTVFHGKKAVWHADMPVRAAVTMALGGCSVFAGILVSAIIMEKLSNGPKIVACAASTCLVLGGALIAVGRWQRCRMFWIAI
jgi:hypothetical protein